MTYKTKDRSIAEVHVNSDILDFGRAPHQAGLSFSPAEIRLFSDLLQELQSVYGPRLQSVKLVGSRARDTAMERSDYDFLIFLDTCSYDIEVPRLQRVSYELGLKHGLGCLSLSPMTREQFLSLDAKYGGITENFRRDAINLWP